MGKSNNITAELFAFNIGLEVGQLSIVSIVLVCSYLAVQIIKINRREWNLFLSSAIFGIAFIMAIERLSILV